MRTTFLVLTLVALASPPAAAADDASPFEAKSTAVYAILGVGTPVGFMGAEIEQTVLPNWSLSAGLGWGHAMAPQASAMMRWMGGGQRSKVTIGAGVSGGKYTWTEYFCIDCDQVEHKSGTVAWGNVEVGGEHRFWNGFAIRYFGGYGRIVAGNYGCDPPDDVTCQTYYKDDGINIVYTGIGLGGAF